MISDDGYVKIKRYVFNGMLVGVVAIMGIVLLLFLIKYVTRKRFAEISDRNKLTEEKLKGEVINKWSGLYKFSKSEIEKAINFGNSKVNLGSGSAGQVYQGVLPSGQLVAIKHIYKTAMDESFTREVEGLSKIRHPNLVCLFGYCDEDDEKYLVYEYCCKGNLAQNLLRSDSVLSWDKRIKILRQCALALRFLHTHPDGCIVHRDIKAKDVVNGKRPLKDFIDPRLNGELSLKDFESILRIAVLCVASSSKGRPTIKDVIDELDKAWENTSGEVAETKREILASSISFSQSSDVLEV